MKVNLINENFQKDYLQNLLATRGVTDINKFLDPPIDCLQDPKWLWDIETGAQWLNQVLKKEDSCILLVVDCDVDGFTSSAIIYNYIKQIKPDQEIEYILHEGKQHGLEDHMDFILNCNSTFDLIILPDSSSNDYEKHELLGT